MRWGALPAALFVLGACGASDDDGLRGTWTTAAVSHSSTALPIVWRFGDKSVTLSLHTAEGPPYEETLLYTLDTSVAPAQLFIILDGKSRFGDLLGSGKGIAVWSRAGTLALKLALPAGMVPRITSPEADGFADEPGFVVFWLKRAAPAAAE